MCVVDMCVVPRNDLTKEMGARTRESYQDIYPYIQYCTYERNSWQRNKLQPAGGDGEAIGQRKLLRRAQLKSSTTKIARK